LQSGERVEVGRVVPCVEPSLEAALSEQVRDRGALVRPHRRPQLEHLAPEARDQAFAPGARGDRAQHRERGLLVVRTAVVEADGERLPFDVVPVHAGSEGLEPVAPRQSLRLELEAVLADIDELVETDDSARIGARAAADAGNERVAAVQPAQLLPGRLRHGRRVRHVHDRCQDTVDVEQDRRPIGLRSEPREQ
jgi:hypothetical protein